MFCAPDIQYCAACKIEEQLACPLAGGDTSHWTVSNAVTDHVTSMRSDRNSQLCCKVALRFHLRNRICIYFPLHGGFCGASKGAPKGGWGLPGCGPETPQNRTLRNIDFVAIMISNVLRNFSFCRNQPLKSAD